MPIRGVEHDDWVIRAAVLRKDLTEEQKDLLEKRLNITIKESLPTKQFTVLIEPLRATQLLKAIGRPVNPELYRDQIHSLLRHFHSQSSGGFSLAGGFKDYNTDKISVGSLRATATAVQLMEIYGIPSDLDINWVRSYLRPMHTRSFNRPEKWMAAATLNRLNNLPGAKPITWLEAIYYERMLLAAVVLVCLCIYATWSAPLPIKVPVKDKIDAEHSTGDQSTGSLRA
jgi:hypothetical protein